MKLNHFLRNFFPLWSIAVSILMMNLSLISCASRPKSESTSKTIEIFEGKAQIHNLNSGKKDNVDFVIQGLSPSRLRFDFYGIFGIPVGTLILNPSQVGVLLHTKKTYYSAAPKSEALTPLIKVNLDPKILYLLAWDAEGFVKNQKLSNWKCSYRDAYLDKCISTDNVFTITWSERSSPRKRIIISGQGVEIQFLIKDYKTKDILWSDDLNKGSSEESNPFHFEPPDDYKLVQIERGSSE